MALKIGRTELRVHPLALMFPIAAALLGGREDGFALPVGLAVHECGHLLAAKALGVDVPQLRLMPIGGAIQLENPYGLPPWKLLCVAAAGPAGSALALLTSAALAHWGLLSPLPALALLRVNLTLMLFNLLPALPLDGGRMLYALLSPRVGPRRAVRVGILLGRVTAAGLLAAALVGCFAPGRFNLSFALAAVFMLASAGDERRALGQSRLQAMLRRLRPISAPAPARLYAVGADCCLQEALRAARPDALTLYAVYKGSRLSSITDDRRLLEAALNQGDTTVGEACGRRA